MMINNIKIGLKAQTFRNNKNSEILGSCSVCQVHVSDGDRLPI